MKYEQQALELIDTIKYNFSERNYLDKVVTIINSVQRMDCCNFNIFKGQNFMSDFDLFITFNSNEALRLAIKNAYSCSGFYPHSEQSHQEVLSKLFEHSSFRRYFTSKSSLNNNNNIEEITNTLTVYHHIIKSRAIINNPTLLNKITTSHDEVIDILLDRFLTGYDPERRPCESWGYNRLLCLAASLGYKSLVIKLFNISPCSDIRIDSCDDVIEKALDNDHSEIVEEILAHQTLRHPYPYLLKYIKTKVEGNVLVGFNKLLRYNFFVQNIESYLLHSFQQAMEHNDIANVDWLLEHRETKWLITREDNNIALYWAAEHNHLTLFNVSLSTWTARYRIAWEGIEALRIAHSKNHTTIINMLLEYNSVFCYAEQHTDDYGFIVAAFIERFIEDINIQAQIFGIEHPNGVFNLHRTLPNGEFSREYKEKLEMCHLVLRNLIRTYTTTNNNSIKINQLLNIPAINNNAAYNDNELLRFAFSLGHLEISQRLLEIREINILAVQSNYYRNETQGAQIDLRALATNRESSMTALSIHEKKILKAVDDKYGSTLKQIGGAERAVDNFIENLKIEYDKNPIKVTNASYVNVEDKRWFNIESWVAPKENGPIIILPLTWHELKKLKLDSTQEKAAFYAYRKNNIHTAYRYFMKPNHWMASNAGYVSSLPNNGGMYSSFERYTTLIAILWLAVSDENEPERDGINTQGRIAEFVRSIALINRAHNWDNTRTNPTTNKQEEYDDMEGDKPSCYGGVNRRLFQSVNSHSLFAPGATTEVLNAELRNFVYQYYKTLLEGKSFDELVMLNQEVENTFAELELKSDNKIPNIPVVNQQAFFDEIKTKYDIPDTELYFKKIFKKSFDADPGSANDDLLNNHFLRFYTKCGLQEMHLNMIESKSRTLSTRPKALLH